MMPNPKLRVDVKVTLGPPGSPQSFKFETNDVPMFPGNILIFQDDPYHRGFDIYFHIENLNGQGWLFPQESDYSQGTKKGAHLADALWVDKSVDCPIQPNQWTHFEAKAVENSGRTLHVENANPKPEIFSYTLRLRNNDGQWLSLDPGGVNQNGGGNNYASLALYTAISGGLVGALIPVFMASEFSASNSLIYGIGGALIGGLVGLLVKRG